MLCDRIARLEKLTLQGKMTPLPIKTEYDREDIFLSRHTKAAKQICDFILNPDPVITEYSKFTGFFRFDDSVVGDYFNANAGYTATTEVMDAFYLKEVDGLSVMEWQHAVGRL